MSRTRSTPDALMLTGDVHRMAPGVSIDELSRRGQHLLSMPAATASQEAAERAAAEYAAAERMVRRLANRHGCKGMCARPEHTRDLAPMAAALDALGLTGEATS